jgi:alpha-L-rhamnosidase
MNKSLNLMAVETKKNESYVAIELDISSLNADTSSRAKLNIYRVGYSSSDKSDKPFKTLSISQKIINNVNKFDKHSIYTECNFDLFDFFVDGSDDTHKLKDPTVSSAPAGRFGPRGINLNPVGSGNNYISFPMLADIGFKTDANQTAHFSKRQLHFFHKMKYDKSCRESLILLFSIL